MSIIVGMRSQYNNPRHFSRAHNSVYTIISFYSLNCSPAFAYLNRQRLEVAPGNQKNIISIILTRILREIALIFITSADNCDGQSKRVYVLMDKQEQLHFAGNSDCQFTALARV